MLIHVTDLQVDLILDALFNQLECITLTRIEPNLREYHKDEEKYINELIDQLNAHHDAELTQ